MKLEFFEDGLEGGPLLLLYEGEPEEVGLVRVALRKLAEGSDQQLDFDRLPFVETIDGCRLRAIVAPKSVGVVLTRAPRAFEWTLDAESWLQVEELLEPFDKPHEHVAFQYLNCARGPEVIYSTARAW